MSEKSDYTSISPYIFYYFYYFFYYIFYLFFAIYFLFFLLNVVCFYYIICSSDSDCDIISYSLSVNIILDFLFLFFLPPFVPISSFSIITYPYISYIIFFISFYFLIFLPFNSFNKPLRPIRSKFYFIFYSFNFY